MKILYIARDAGEKHNGAGMVMTRNLKVLQNIVGFSNVKIFTLPPSNLKNVFLSLLHRSSYGVPRTIESKIAKEALSFNPDYIFIDSTSFGSLVKRLTKIAPVIAFAHNLDTKLCRDEIGTRPPWITIPKYLMTKYNEANTVKYASHIICLNHRDSDGFKNTFNREADIILPITFPLKDLSIYNKAKPSQRPYFLFVGSDFFPNIEGIKWFIEKVSPYVDVDFHIVGSCCLNEKVYNLSLPSNVKLLGYVDDLDHEYYLASGVIAPIFKGSGMKTKTIEALSYGKSIIGTSEAFVGIVGDLNQIGGLCESAQDFISALKRSYNLLNTYSEELFKDFYSDAIFENKLSTYLNNNKCN